MYGGRGLRRILRLSALAVGSAILHGHVGSLLAQAVGELAAGLAGALGGALHLNLVAHGFLLVFGHQHAQHAVLKVGLNLARLHGIGQMERALERAVGAFHNVVAAFILLVLKLPLARNGKPALMEIHLNVLAFQARQSHLNLVAFFGFIGINLRREGTHAPPAGHRVLEEPVEHSGKALRHHVRKRILILLNSHDSKF